MSGIYIHIPFCSSKCHYCNFYSVVSKSLIEDFVTALCKEIDLQQWFFKDYTIETLYFGGGTPSILPLNLLELIFNKLQQHISIKALKEVTFEANPDNVNLTLLNHLKNLGVNRISIGTQSFNDNELKILGRKHNAQTAIQSIEKIIQTGFSNFSVDLIYGIPNSDNHSLYKNLNIIRQFQVPHISCYALTQEPKTPYDVFIKKGKITPLQESEYVSQYVMLTDFLNQNNYTHYEISNFCLPEQYAKHNTSYWFGKPYLGLGPSAHSFYHHKRTWNVAHLKKYIKSIAENKLLQSDETINDVEAYNEYVMTRMRTVWGIDIAELKEKFSSKLTNHFLSQLKKINQSDLFIIENNTVRFTEKGMLTSDYLLVALFFDDEA